MNIPFPLFCLILPVMFSFSGSLQEAIGLYEKGKFTQAASMLQQLSASTPSDPEIWNWLSNARLKTREWDKAVEAMEKAVRLQPANARYRLLLGRAYGSQASHSSLFTAMGRARRVIKEFETARTLAPDNIDVRFDLLEYYLDAPGIVGGGKEKAAAEVQAIARLSPKKGFVARATVHIKNKQWDLARKELTAAATENAQSVSANKDLAEFLLDRQDFEAALNYANKALRLDGESKRSRLIAAAAKIRLRSGLQEAADALRDLLAGSLGEGDPAFEEVHYWLGEYFLLKGEKARALEAFQSSLAFNPEFSRAKDGISRSR